MYENYFYFTILMGLIIIMGVFMNVADLKKY